MGRMHLGNPALDGLRGLLGTPMEENPEPPKSRLGGWLLGKELARLKRLLATSPKAKKIGVCLDSLLPVWAHPFGVFS